MNDRVSTHTGYQVFKLRGCQVFDYCAEKTRFFRLPHPVWCVPPYPPSAHGGRAWEGAPPGAERTPASAARSTRHSLNSTTPNEQIGSLRPKIFRLRLATAGDEIRCRSH
jgi:hypothetical protein